MSPRYDHRNRCAIVGIGNTDYSRDSGRSDLTLATQASLAAIADSGLETDDIDGIVRCDMDLVKPVDLVASLGLSNLTYFSEVGPGGVAPAAMIGQAVGALLSGQASAVLVFRSLNGRSGVRYGQSMSTSRSVGGSGTYDEFFMPYGLVTPGQAFAMIAQRHMSEFGTRPEHLGQIAVTCRARANANPAAQMFERCLTMEDYLDSRVISSPLRLFDFCLESDGAAAVVVTTAERARDLRRTPVLIRAVSQGSVTHPQPGTTFPSLLRETITTLPALPVARTLYARAGLGHDDIDVAQLYDCYTITVLLQLEDYGFCSKGEGGPFVQDGNIDMGGTIPINTGGGHLSEGYIHGMNPILEGVRQMRGHSTSQVPGAQTCLVTCSPLPPGSAMILQAEP